MNAEDTEDDKERVVDGEESEVDGRQRHVAVPFIGGVIVLSGALIAEIPLTRLGFGWAAAGAVLATAIWFTFLRAMRLRGMTPGAGVVIVVAILLRVPFFFAEPALSGDVYRYRWDGIVSSSGINPYRFAPDASQLAHLRDGPHGLINHPEIPTVYPPLAEALFWIWGLAGAGLWLWRLVIVSADVAVILLLNRRAAIAWATCPLVIFEGTWSGHLEAVVAALLLGSCVAMRRRREVGSGMLAAAAVGLKITPLAALPALVRESASRMRFSVALATTILLPFALFAGGPVMSGFRQYAVQWEFNGLLYETFKWTVETTHFDHAVKALFSAIKGPLGLEAISGVVYAQLYPALMARALCLAGLPIMLAFAMKRPTFHARVGWSVAALLLASPTLHPWYWLAVLPFAFLDEDVLLTCLAVASSISYVWYVDAELCEALSLALCYGLPLVVGLISARRRGATENLLTTTQTSC